MKDRKLSRRESLGKNTPASYNSDCKGIAQEATIVNSDYLTVIERENSKAEHSTHDLIGDELRFLRPKEVAAILGISRQMLWRMRKAGKFIHPVKITDFCVGYRSDDLLDWMNNRQPVDGHE